MVQTAIIKQDLLYPSVSPVVYAVQGDNFTREIQILLFSGGQPITISEDCSAIIGYRKPDGTSGAYDSFSDESGTTPAYDISENSFRFFLAPEMLSEPGDVFITVKITNEGKSLHSFELILSVQKNHGLEPHSENYFKIAGTVADSGWSPNEYLGTDENGKVVAKKLDGTFVKTVNGVAPDENGNVEVQGGSGGGSGEAGADGFSPIAKVTQTDTGAVVTITDKSGTTTATIVNGKDGADGKDGSNGKDGVSATHSWNGTTLTITSASGTSSADLKGATGNPGKDGSDGQPGADGVSPTVAVSKSGKVTTVAITDKNGTKTATINDGADGSPGSAGKDGTSVTVKSVSESTADGGNNVVTFSDGKTFTVKNGSKGSTGATGATGATGKNGADGYTPVRGTDYWTEADKVEIVQRVIESLGGNPIFGIVDENNNIIVSGDLPDGTYSVKYEMENGSKVNIGNLVIDTNVYYTVTNTLTQCTTNNSATKAVQGGSYSATITAKSGYELSSIVVKMGGTDISSTAVSGGKITIANVTGNIVITAVAEVAKPAYTNFADPTSADWKTGYRLTTNIDGVTALTGGVVTNYIPIQLGDTLAVEGINFTDGNDRTAFNGTNASIAKASVIKSTWVSGGYAENVSYDNNSLTLTITDKCTNTNKIRFSGTATGTSNDVVVKIKRNGEWL